MVIYQKMKRVVPVKWKIRILSLKGLLEDKATRIQRSLKGGVRIPPPDLIYLVSGHKNAAKFLRGGKTASQAICETLEKNGINIEEFSKILDFGCGVGRIMRYLNTLQGPAIYGTDYNPHLIRWCKSNLNFAEFEVNTLSDELTYESETFDFIYAFSVFTHLNEQLQFHWIRELTRVLRPGGHLYLTTHGEHYISQFTLEQKEQFRNGQLVVLGAGQAGTNYCAAYHPNRYVQERLAKNLTVVNFIARGARGNSEQDVYLLKKPLTF
jgi:SAM-dependent methyltransferase